MCIDLPQDRFSSNLWKPLVRILEFTLEAHQHNFHICVLLFFFRTSPLLANQKETLLKIHSAVSLCAPDLLTQIIKLVEAVGEHDFQEYP
jgi:hypothetical protein